MAYIPYSPQVGARYTLTDPISGFIAVFNDEDDANYVGMLTSDGFSGLDSAEIRESASDLVESDGGEHGAFYFGRRPITMTGRVFGHASDVERDLRIDKLRRVCKRGMRTDLILGWQNNPTSANAAMQTWVRLQQPLRVTGGWVKDFNLALVSKFAFLYAQTLSTAGPNPNGTAIPAAENKGDWPATPIITIAAPGAGSLTNPVVTCSTTGLAFRTTGLTLAAGETVQFDVLNHTGKFTAGARNGQSANRYIDYAATDWPTLPSGTSAWVLSGSSGGTLSLTWRSTWS